MKTLALAPLLLSFALPGCRFPGVAATPKPADDAPATSASSPASTAETAPASTAESTSSDDGFSERTLKLGTSSFTVKLPCKPKGDKEDSEDNALGHFVFRTFSCEASAQKIVVNFLVGRYDKPLPDDATNDARNAKSTAAVKLVGKDTCDEFKHDKVSCKVGTPMAASGIVATSLYLPEDAGDVRIYARYPYVAVITTTGEKKSPDVNRILGSFKFPTAP